MTTIDPSGSWAYADAQAYLARVRSGFPPMIICAAINGGVQGKEYNPALPETVAEIAASAREAYRAGASIIHVHARDPSDLTRGARDAATWIAVVGAIREGCPGVIVNATTGGDLSMSMAERLGLP